ncbi:helix-turn-helix domain-containing protein [Bacteroides sp.]|uniref:ligand-binding sensor domain-containing protein n=1 Tax=Bacteroides sp. TaxID=29523 RepID=UPI0025B7DC12|nr:helix-turn-helix domain-containing protein [Bacteroides sp.]
MKIPLLIIVLLVSLSGYSGNTQDLYLTSLDQKDGLSNSAVLSFYKDNSGLMWIGTYDGLNCYDGSNIEIFRTDFSENTTFYNNIILNISYAGDNNVWICSYNGVSLMSLWSRNVIDNYSQEEYFKLYSNSIGNTWVIDNSFIYYFNKVENKFIKAYGNHGIDPEKSTAYVGEDGIFTIIGDGKTSSLSCMASSFEKDSASTSINVYSEEIHKHPVIHSFCQNSICCFIDSNNDLYMYDFVRKYKLLITNTSSLIKKYGTISGIVPFYDDLIVYFHSQAIVRLKSSNHFSDELLRRNVRVFCTYLDNSNGILWIGTDGQGLISIAKKTGIVNNILLDDISHNLSGQIRGLLTDSLDNLWVGTKGDGLLCIPKYINGFSAEEVKAYMPQKVVPMKSYIRDNGFYPVFKLENSDFLNGFWVGMSDSLLYYYSREKDMLKPLDGFAYKNNTEIHGIYEEGDSAIWVATIGAGLKRIKLEYDDGLPCALGYDDFHIYTGQREILSFSSLCAYNDSILWLGSRGNGVVKFNINKGKYEVISLKNITGKYVDDVLSLHINEKTEKLYVGSTAGLVVMELKNLSLPPYYIGRENGLVNDMIHGIVSNKDGILWLGTNRGLVKYNPCNDVSYTYYYSRGVEIAEFSDDSYYVCPYTGNLFLGGVNGLVYIDSNTIKSPEFYSDILLGNVSLGYEKKYWTDFYNKEKESLVFPDKYNAFSLKFSAPDYIAKDIEYSYMLEGYDKEWSRFSYLNEAFFSSIPVGKYLFKVRYKKDMLNETYREFSIPLCIEGPWYKSWWAYVIYICILFLLVAMLIKLCKPYIMAYLSNYFCTKEVKSDKVVFYDVDNIYRSSYDIIIERLGEGIKEELTINSIEQADFLLKVIKLIDEFMEVEDLSVSLLADKCNVSTRQFYRKFKECILISPIDLVKRMRMEKAAVLLLSTDMSIQEVIDKIGISSRSYFYKEFTAKFGMTPGAMRDNSVAKSDDKS